MTWGGSWFVTALLVAATAPVAAPPRVHDVDRLNDLAPERGGVFEGDNRHRYEEALDHFFGEGVPIIKCQMITESQSFPWAGERAVFFHRRGAFEAGTVVARAGLRDLSNAVIEATSGAGPSGDWREHLDFTSLDVVEHRRSIDAELADVLDQVCDMMLGRLRHPVLDVAVSAREVHFSHVTLAHGRRTGRLVGSVGGYAKRFRDLLQGLGDFATAPEEQAPAKRREVMTAAKQLRSSLIASGSVPLDLKRERHVESLTVPIPAPQGAR